MTCQEPTCAFAALVEWAVMVRQRRVRPVGLRVSEQVECLHPSKYTRVVRTLQASMTTRRTPTFEAESGLVLGRKRLA